MNDPLADTDEVPIVPDMALQNIPLGYVRHEESIARVKATVALACGVSNGIIGAASGCNYFNLTSFIGELLQSDQVVTSKRKTIDCGSDGIILQPLGQETGICDGCGFGESGFASWCARYIMTGTGDKPRECSFLWPYVAGRQLNITGRGDTGACPPYSAQAYHDIGVLPVDCGSPFDLSKLPPHGPNSQESLCIQMRDNPRILQEWRDAAAPFKCRIYSPDPDPEIVADCIKTGRAVNTAGTLQPDYPQVGGNGVSRLYTLRDAFGRPAGHATFLSGFFRLNGVLHGIQTNSWWNVEFPGRDWPEKRVTVQTDDGLKKLYPGQAAFNLKDWLNGRPELWAIDGPGTR